MIYVLHGEDTLSSYLRLQNFEKSFNRATKKTLSKEDNLDNFYLAVWGENLFETTQLIICKDLLVKINIKKIKDVPSTKTIIFWESTQLTSKVLSPLKNLAIIENFKPKSELFWFLDSLSPHSKQALEIYQKLKIEDYSMLWNITQRVLLLILIKIGTSRQNLEKIIGRKMKDWQFSKIENQTGKFDITSLMNFFSGTLKLDFAIKNGATNHDQKFLISLLLLKYLKI